MKWVKENKSKRELKRIYTSLLPEIRAIARYSGYAIGLHGSMTRDLDLIAVPWTKKYTSPELLISRIERTICQYPEKDKKYYKRKARIATDKPHGRKAYVLHVGFYAYIDLSVITIKTNVID